MQVSSGLKTEIEMVIRRSEMRGHPGKEVGVPSEAMDGGSVFHCLYNLYCTPAHSL